MLAITRPVSAAFASCELTHLHRAPIDVARAERQHAAYEDLLVELGCTLERLPAEPAMPDAVFVEDAAVVVDELAVITRPGAPSRRGETASVAAALARHLPIARITPPATLDGGDVLRVGRRLFVGASARSDAAGIAQLRALLAPYGYEVTAVALHGCLHLKTAVTEVADGLLLVNRDWIDTAPFAGCELLAVDPAEPFAANALRLGDAVVLPAAFPRTAERLTRRLAERGAAVRTVEVDEIAKAEGGVTCCSILVPATAA